MEFILLSVLLVLGACSFKSVEDVEKAISGSSPIKVDLSTKDSDGDMVNDLEEINGGRNPHVADLPDLRVRFLQNYKIETFYSSEGSAELESFVMDTKVGRDDPSFKYRIGEIFIRDYSYSKAASIGRFATHSWGRIEDRDLTWIKYPEIDPIFYSKLVLDNKKYFDSDRYQISGNKITLENSVRLNYGGAFREIKNLELNFYYFDYEKDNYQLLKTELVERHFMVGVNEVFQVEIDNVPNNLIGENYLKKGEFIISEIKDFDIPELGIKYSTLLASVKNKTVSVIYNTPSTSEHYYVATRGGKARFVDILSDLFDTNYQLEDNKLIKVRSFENNLGDFTYLKDVKGRDKQGRWYVLTNKLRKHYLDHNYQNKDVLALSYITGTELASQMAEEVSSFREGITGGDDGFTVFPVGNISPNSKIDIQLMPIRRWGEDRTVNEAGYEEHNRYFDMECSFKYYTFQAFDEQWFFSNKLSNEEMNRIKIVVNGKEFSLLSLYREEKISLTTKKGSLHIEIDDVAKIVEIAEFEENLISIKLETFKESTPQGLKLESKSGRTASFCPEMMGRYAWQFNPKLSIASDSVDCGAWRRFMPWATFLNPKEYSKHFSINLVSTINNYFN